MRFARPARTLSLHLLALGLDPLVSACAQAPDAPVAAPVDPAAQYAALKRELAARHEARDWQAVVKVLEQMVRVDSDAKRRANSCYTLGVIHRDELSDPERAMKEFKRALFIDPKALKPLEAADALARKHQKWWSELCDLYSEVLQQPALDPELMFKLYYNRALIRRDHLQLYQAALSDLRTAQTVRRDDASLARLIKELEQKLSSSGPPL